MEPPDGHGAPRARSKEPELENVPKDPESEDECDGEWDGSDEVRLDISKGTECNDSSENETEFLNQMSEMESPDGPQDRSKPAEFENECDGDADDDYRAILEF